MAFKNKMISKIKELLELGAYNAHLIAFSSPSAQEDLEKINNFLQSGALEILDNERSALNLAVVSTSFSGWISVKDLLPTEDDYEVYCWVKDWKTGEGNGYILYRENGKWLNDENMNVEDTMDMNVVTHWQKLPNKPSVG